MNKEVIRLWVNTLRSGRFKQGRGCLNDMQGHYCCLGVLCELGVEANIIPPPDIKLPHYARYSGQWAVLPSEIIKWAGLDENAPNLFLYAKNQKSSYYRLSVINDDIGSSFGAIADMIEANFLKEGE